MTEPGFVPPPSPGWWVKKNNVVFPTAAVLTLTGGVPTITRGPTVSPTGATLTLTGGTPTITIGPTVRPTGATLTLTGGTPRLVTEVRPTGASLTLTGGTPRVGAQYSDDFNRADSTTSIGTNWTNQQFTMGINGNAAYPFSQFVQCYATFTPIMTFDDMIVSITAGTLQAGGNDGVQIVLGANSTGECVVGSFLQGNPASIRSLTAWASETSRATTAGNITYASGDVLSIERTGNVYTVKQNGSTIGLSWTDSGNIVPRNSTHRIVGLGANTAGGSGYRRIDAWSAQNI